MTTLSLNKRIAFAVLGLLLLAVNPCFALRSIGYILQKEAKEMGLEVRANGSGPDQVWVELEFKAEGKLKDFHHAELEIQEGEKVLIAYAALRETRPRPGHIVIRFLTDRSYLHKISVQLVLGEIGDQGWIVRVKDFVEADKPR